MVGPGIAECMASVIVDGTPTIDQDVFAQLSFSRDFYAAKVEALK